jgi:ubiquinol-cytochrome c reductase cytochrome b subunit
LHFLLPWLIILFIFIHLFFLHESGRTSLLLCFGDYDKVNFYPHFYFKDLLNVSVVMLFLIFILYFPFLLGDPEIFIEANPLASPIHIVPEWYFLFAYAILRSIPNKTLGVLTLVLSLAVLFGFGLLDSKISCLSIRNSLIVINFIFCCVMLSWLGQCVLEHPFLYLGKVFSFLYFFFIFIIIGNFVIPELLIK